MLACGLLAVSWVCTLLWVVLHTRYAAIYAKDWSSWADGALFVPIALASPFVVYGCVRQLVRPASIAITPEGFRYSTWARSRLWRWEDVANFRVNTSISQLRTIVVTQGLWFDERRSGVPKPVPHTLGSSWQGNLADMRDWLAAALQRYGPRTN